MIQTPFPPFDPDGQNGPLDRRGLRLREIPIRMVWPNLITVLAICAGLTGIRLAFEGKFESAIVMVLLAAFLDGIDGRIARMLKATSRFGAELDSLADSINFGAAPALVLYAYLLHEAHSLGWIAALSFAIACCLRLARFNVMISASEDSGWRGDYFVGVPAPAGGVLVMLPVYLGFLGLPVTPAVAYVSAVYALFVALLLISRLPVFSGKSFGQRVRVDIVFPGILVAALIVLFLFSYTWLTLTLGALLYLGFLPYSVRAYRRADRREQAEQASNGEQYPQDIA